MIRKYLQSGNVKPYKIIFMFYFFYAVSCIIGNLIINYRSLHFITLLIVFIYLSSLITSSYLAFHFFKDTSKYLFKFNLNKLLFLLALVLTFTVFYSWHIYIRYYGSLEYIIFNAYTIRVNSIGGSTSILPTYLTYINSLVYASFALGLFKYEETKLKRYIFLSLWFFILIILCDLFTFGRIGILYSIFIFLGYLIIYRKLKFNFRIIITAFILFFILMIPRLIRGSFDNMELTVQNYAPYFKVNIPNYFNSFISAYVYYFSSIYAFDFYIQKPTPELTYGTRMFTPIVNIATRIFSYERINNIDPMAHIPFEYNIYSIIKDMYSDFSIVGVVFYPLMVGIWFGYIFKKKSTRYRPIQAYSLAWLFYTPLYNAFSFGSFLISFVFLYILTFMRDANEKNEYHYCQL